MSKSAGEWEPWQTTAAVERAYGQSLGQIALMVGRHRHTVARFCSRPETQAEMLRIRRDANTQLYGAALKLGDRAIEVLSEMLDDASLKPDMRLRCVDMVRRLIGDQAVSDSGAAYREATRRMKQMQVRD